MWWSPPLYLDVVLGGGRGGGKGGATSNGSAQEPSLFDHLLGPLFDRDDPSGSEGAKPQGVMLTTVLSGIETRTHKHTRA